MRQSTAVQYFRCIALILVSAFVLPALRAQNGTLPVVELEPESSSAQIAAARQALMAGRTIVRLSVRSLADAGRMLNLQLPEASVSVTNSANQGAESESARRSLLQSVAVYFDARHVLHSIQLLAPASADRSLWSKLIDQWIERNRDSSLHPEDVPNQPTGAWTTLYTSTVIATTDHANTEQDTLSVYRLNTNESANDYYLIYLIPQSQPKQPFGYCQGANFCDWHTVDRSFNMQVPNGIVVEHGPTNLNGQTNVSFNIGVGLDGDSPGGNVGFGLSWTQPDVTTIDSTNAPKAIWEEKFNPFGVFGNPCFGPFPGPNPPLTSTDTFYSRLAAILQISGGTQNVTVAVNDATKFCAALADSTTGETANVSWNLPLGPPVLAATPLSLTIPPGGTSSTLVSAYIPNSQQGLAWNLASNEAWLTVPSNGPFSGSQPVPISVAAGTQLGSQGTISVDTSSPDAAPSVISGPIDVNITVGQPKPINRAGVLLIGGLGSAGTFADTTLYDLTAKVALPTGQLAVPRYGHTATPLRDGRVVVIGGAMTIPQNPQPAATTGLAEIFSAASLSFNSSGTMQYPRFYHSAILLPDGKIFVAGGTDSRGNYVPQAELFDPSTGRFSSAGTMAQSLGGTTRAVLLDETSGHARVLVFGGAQSTATEIWNEQTNSFSPGPQMAGVQSNSAQPVLDSEGRYETNGGAGSDFTYIATEQHIQSQTGTFSEGPSLIKARLGQTLTVLQNGAMLVTGGTADQIGTAEIKSSPSSPWALTSGSGTCPGAAGCMLAYRQNHSATLLPDGTVLLVGGFNSNSSAQPTTEIYSPESNQFTFGPTLSARTDHTANLISSSSITLTATPSPAVADSTVTLIASVNVATGVPSGTVTFYDGAKQIGTAPLESDTATLRTAALAAGTHSLTASYPGDAINAPSTSPAVAEVVGMATATIAASSSANPSSPGQTVRFHAAVGGAAGTPSGTVTFSDGNNLLATVQLNSGEASYSTSTLAIGTHAIEIVYSGDSVYASSSAALTQTVQPQNTSTSLSATPKSTVYGHPIHLAAAVSGGQPRLKGVITFKDGNNVLGKVNLIARAAVLAVDSLTAGEHSLAATYSGDASHDPSTSSPVMVTVARAVPSVKLTSSINPSIVGHPVTFTAMLNGGPSAPTGSVTFTDGTNQIGEPAALFNGIATVSTSILAAGQHRIFAAYTGDSNYVSTSSTAFPQVVQNLASTTTTISSSENPSFGGPVIFTVSVTSQTGVPTGTVALTEGSVSYGSGSLKQGHAQITVSNLPSGINRITASYSGDSTHSPSSTYIHQVVFGIGHNR